MNISSVSSSASIYASAVTTRRSGGAGGSGQLTAEEQVAVRELQARDREVRLHEQAHIAAGGGLVTSGASFTYQRGPDGANYAVGGEVRISTSPGRTPDETIRRAQRIRAAALAPAEPSGQDRAVAAHATQMEQDARMEKSREIQSGNEDSGESRSAGAIRAYTDDHERRSVSVDVYA